MRLSPPLPLVQVYFRMRVVRSLRFVPAGSPGAQPRDVKRAIEASRSPGQRGTAGAAHSILTQLKAGETAYLLYRVYKILLDTI